MSMSREEILKLVDDLYAATGVGDFDTAAEMLTDDFFITEADSLPMAGVITRIRWAWTRSQARNATRVLPKRVSKARRARGWDARKAAPSVW